MPAQRTKRPPTPKQLAEASDIALRYLATTELSPEEQTQVESAAHLMGFSALARDREQDELDDLA